MVLEIKFVAFLATVRSAAISSVTISIIAALISPVIFFTVFFTISTAHILTRHMWFSSMQTDWERSLLRLFRKNLQKCEEMPVSGAFLWNWLSAGRSFLSLSEPPMPANLFCRFVLVRLAAHLSARPKSQICSPFYFASILRSL